MQLKDINLKKKKNLKFNRSPPRSKVHRMHFRFASWSSFSLNGLEAWLDPFLHFEVDWRHCFSLYLNSSWMCTMSTGCFNSWICINFSPSSNINCLSPKIKPMWGISMTWSSFAISWSMALSYDGLISFYGGGIAMGSIRWLDSLLFSSLFLSS